MKYKKGLANNQADTLSRSETFVETEIEIDDEMPCMFGEVLRTTKQPDGAEGKYSSTLDFLIAKPIDTEPPEQLEPISSDEILLELYSDPSCKAIGSIPNGGKYFEFGERGVLMLTVEVQDYVVMPHVLKIRVLHVAHYSQLAGHPGGTNLYMTLRNSFYWPTMAMNGYATAEICSTCAKNRIKLWNEKKPTKLFPATAPLEYVCIDILGELIGSTRGNHYLLLIPDLFTKVVLRVALETFSAPDIAKAFIHNWGYIYGPPKTLL